MSNTVWKSDSSAYGRRVYVERMEHSCDVCDQQTTVLDVDTSDGEYLSWACCQPCFTKLVGDKK
jgi:hypothetical protein